MATQQSADNQGWITDAWNFVDNGLSRAGDVLKTYVNWDQYQENKETAEAKRGFLDNYSDFLGSMQPSRRAGDTSASQTGGVWGRPGGGGPSMATIAVVGIGAVLLLRRV